jgi:hypothetical protein
MDHPTTIRLKASVQTLVFVILLAATLFGSAGRFDIIEFWVYIAIVVAVSVAVVWVCTFYRSSSLCFCTGPWLASIAGTSISLTQSRLV